MGLLTGGEVPHWHDSSDWGLSHVLCSTWSMPLPWSPFVVLVGSALERCAISRALFGTGEVSRAAAGHHQPSSSRFDAACYANPLGSSLQGLMNIVQSPCAAANGSRAT